jgi:hypothetical protein
MSVPTDTQPSEPGGARPGPTPAAPASAPAMSNRLPPMAHPRSTPEVRPEMSHRPPPPPPPPAQPPAPPAAPPEESGFLVRFSKHIAPILALMALLLSFGLFIYFIYMMNQPITYLSDLKDRYQELNKIELEIQDLSASQAAGRDQLVEQAQVKLRQKQADLKAVITALSDGKELIREQRGAMKDFVLYILGVLSSLVTTIFGYYFGSSSSSSNKDKALHAALQSNTAAGAPPEKE